MHNLARRRSIAAVPLVAFLLALLVSAAAAASGDNTIFIPLAVRASGPLAPITATMRWSDPATWPGAQLPQAGDDLVIPQGKDILLDINPPALNSLTISGALVFDNRDLELSVGWIMLHGGALAVGSATQPFTNHATITLTATDPTENQMNMGTRGIMVMEGGRLDLFGSAPAVAWTKLAASVAAGTKALRVVDPLAWRSGDQIVVAPTDFYSVGATELLTITAATDTALNVNAPLQKAHWGQVQYIGTNGLTLTPTTAVTALTLDERAEVGVLTRNVVVQGANDHLWQTQGFGAQIMGMAGATLRLDGVELRHVGQAGKIGRYPVHFHGMSYTAAGSELGDTKFQFVRNSAIWNSKNRCLVLHGTNGVTLENNICYDIIGHAVFLEDAVERHNLIAHNLVLKVRNPPAGSELLKHEGDVFSGGSSAFWITHPDNIVRDNAAADAQGNGIWYSFPEQPLGLFKKAPILSPQHTAFGMFSNNTAHSNQQFGFQMDWVPIDDAGNLTPDSYRPTADGKDPGNVAFAASLPYTIAKLTSYKNQSGALWHREGGGTIEQVVAADNPGRQFAGSANCVIQHSASIGDSLNNATPIATVAPDAPPAGMASYHSSCDIKQHLFINLPFVPGKSSGAFDTSDFYIRPVDRGLFRDSDLRFINAHTGYRQPPFTEEHWTLAGALWDPYGYMGPKGNYWVFNDPFLTDGTACQEIAPAGQTGQSCKGPYYGLQGFVLDKGNAPWGALMPIEVTRDNGAVWAVGDGNTAPKLGNMRHAALVKGGTFALRFPGSPMPHNVEFTVENMLQADDAAILGVQFDGSVTQLKVLASTWPHPQELLNGASDQTTRLTRYMTPVNSLDQVRSSNGDRYYQDTANNLVYIKLMHNLPLASTPEPGSDDDLYHALSFVIAAQP